MPDAEEDADTAVEPDAQIAAGPDANPDVLIDGFKPPEVCSVHDVGCLCQGNACGAVQSPACAACMTGSCSVVHSEPVRTDLRRPSGR